MDEIPQTPQIDGPVSGNTLSIDEVTQSWLSIESPVDLASRISHDLIQPLNEIVTNVWLCRELSGDSPACTEFRAVLDSIEDQAMRTARMIRTVRKLVRDRAMLNDDGNSTIQV
ncbi:MAG: hypothetical protein JSS49_15930 [Planctomycetes bacterium]|nr:hypothetical protein [Planctomycetota bacterium]